MTKNTLEACLKKAIVFLILIVFGGCSSSKSNYQREYTRLWKEIIKSEAWKNALLVDTADFMTNNPELYASTANNGIAEDRITTNIDMESLFNERFQSLVSRAYFKIISEAENADGRLTAEYDHWNLMQRNTGLKKDRTFRNKYVTVIKKYNAHKKMLEGLKSWNIFSEFRSNDLDFFMAENRNEIKKMYITGSTEDRMISYLVYKLADLYHFGD